MGQAMNVSNQNVEEVRTKIERQRKLIYVLSGVILALIVLFVNKI